MEPGKFFHVFLSGLAVAFFLLSVTGAFYVYTHPVDTDEMDRMNQMAQLIYYYDVINHDKFHGSNGWKENRKQEFVQWVREGFTLPVESIGDPKIVAWVRRVKEAEPPPRRVPPGKQASL